MYPHYEVRFLRDGVTPCGSDWTHYHHLKTLKGVLRRIRSKGHFHPSEFYKIYFVGSRDSERLVFPYMNAASRHSKN